MFGREEPEKGAQFRVQLVDLVGRFGFAVLRAVPAAGFGHRLRVCGDIIRRDVRDVTVWSGGIIAFLRSLPEHGFKRGEQFVFASVFNRLGLFLRCISRIGRGIRSGVFRGDILRFCFFRKKLGRLVFFGKSLLCVSRLIFGVLRQGIRQLSGRFGLIRGIRGI